MYSDIGPVALAGMGPLGLSSSHMANTKDTPQSRPRGSRTTDKLSEERLARKRAADRHAQQVLRQKTKRRIEELEKRIQELSQAPDEDLALQAAQQRTADLEKKLQELQSIYMVRKRKGLITPSVINNNDASAKVGGTTEVVTDNDVQAPLDQAQLSELTGPYPTRPSPRSTPRSRRRTSQSQTTEGLFPESSSETTLQRRTAAYPNVTTFSRRSLTHVWEFPLPNMNPKSPIDYIMDSVIRKQKIITSAGGSQVLAKGPIFPSINGLIFPGKLTTVHPVSQILTDMLSRLTYRTFVDKMGALLVIYPIFQWQIANDYESFAMLPAYSVPTLLQRTVPHPIWVCAVGWPPLRDHCIKNQERYCTEEFQYMMVHSMNCNWPYGTEAAIQRRHDGYTISEAFWHHVRVMENWSLDEPFQSRYPELEEFCRFTKYPGVIEPGQRVMEC